MRLWMELGAGLIVIAWAVLAYRIRRLRRKIAAIEEARQVNGSTNGKAA